MKRYRLTIPIISLLLWIACDLQDPFGDRRKDLPKDNRPPETHLFLMVNQQVITEQDTLDNGTIVVNTYTAGLDTTSSKQIVHWWGDDPDGHVSGYYKLWNYPDSATNTIMEYDTFYVPIQSKYDEFTLQVWAVDNKNLQDPSPARLTFPVYNSPPEILFLLGSNPRAVGNDNVTSF